MDRLQSYESQPASPCDTPTTSPAPSIRTPPIVEATTGGSHVADAPLPLAPPESSSEVDAPADESTPLRTNDAREYGSAPNPTSRPAAWAHTFPRSKHSGKRRNTIAETSQEIFAGGHHRHEERGSHVEHYGSAKPWRGWFGLGGERGEHQDDGHAHNEEAAGGSARRKKRGDERTKPLSNGHAPHVHDHGQGHRQHHSGHVHSHGHVHMDMERWSPERASGSEEEELVGPAAKVGMRRQVIGILVSALRKSRLVGFSVAVRADAGDWDHDSLSCHRPNARHYVWA